MSVKPNHFILEVAIRKLDAFCCSLSRLKGDEELRASFDRFLTDEHVSSNRAEALTPSSYFTIVEEIIVVLYELEEQLMEQGYKSRLVAGTQGDSSNRLYASLKRHPE